MKVVLRIYYFDHAREWQIWSILAVEPEGFVYNRGETDEFLFVDAETESYLFEEMRNWRLKKALTDISAPVINLDTEGILADTPEAQWPKVDE